MKAKKEKTIFLCQLSEGALSVIKCAPLRNGTSKFGELEIEALAGDREDKELPEKINKAFKKAGYNNEAIILSLPRSQATCRYLKIPSTSPQEIEKILYLQAGLYLPYRPEELITGYQIISTDKEGYAEVNLVVVRRGLIERYLEILRRLKPRNFSIVLSSYGLVNLYNYINPEEADVAMALDINPTQAELVIIAQKKLIFSRAFKINQEEPQWKDIFLEEVNKTIEVYTKDNARLPLNRIVIFGENKNLQDLIETLSKRFSLPVESLSYGQRFNLAELSISLANLIGMGIGEMPDSLNLLPGELKEAARRVSGRKEKIQLVASVAVIICIFALGVSRNMDNKSRHLRELKTELSKVSQEAKPLEELMDRLEAMKKRNQKESSNLDIIYGLYQTVPSQISLTSLDYQDNGTMILRGQTAELSSVFAFVSQMEKSDVFKGFNIKIRYATKRRAASGEITDFEILCRKK